jgi:hypothetical protein
MEQNFALVHLLAQAANRMKTDLRERLISHPGELGTSREEIIRDFLRSYLPRRFEISTGFAFDSAGHLSQQLDIVIADASICPRFENAGKKRLFPCEVVSAVGEIKSSLTSIKELRAALDNLASAKRLDRSANGEALDCNTLEKLDPKSNHLDQIFTFLLITGKCLSETTVRDGLIAFLEENEPSVWPNVIIALEKYLVTFCCDSGICPNPLDARGIAIQKDTDKNDILMHFYLLLARALDATRVSSMPYSAYLKDNRNWNADVWHSCSEYPPPFLSSFMPKNRS